MKISISDIGTGIMVACAFSVAVLAVKRQWHSTPHAVEAPRVKDVAPLLTSGHLIGDASAPTKVIEFADYQCPFCARAQQQMDSVIAQSGGRVAVVYHHYPIENLHARAFQAAIAAECAAEQGDFTAFHHALFAHPEEIGSRPWISFSKPAVLDSTRFTTCEDGTVARGHVVNDMRMADRIGVRATPAFIVDGRLYYGLLPRDILSQLTATARVATSE